MLLNLLTEEEFEHHCNQASERSFLQSLEMGKLLSKRGFNVAYLGLKDNNQVKVSALLYSKPMAGGLHMEINCGPVITNESYLSDFYQALVEYAKTNKAIQLIVKPYNTYQQFDTNGKPITEENQQLINQLKESGFQFDGLQTGYPGGEPDWHYMKELTQLTPETLFSSYSKKGKALVKKANSFGMIVSTLKREDLHRFKAITSATSERREYDDKSLDYYQDFYDSFGKKAEFTIASINFKKYLHQLELTEKQLISKIDNLKKQYAGNEASPKFNRMLSELTSQKETFETRKKEALALIDTYGESDIDLAASLFIFDDKEAVYLFSGSLPEFSKFYAPAVLQEYAMIRATKEHIPCYNMLGITGHFDGTDGVLRFKQNFNGYINRKMGTFRYYPKPITFKAIKLLKTILRR